MKAEIIAVVASWVLAFVGTFIILKILDAIMGLRVSEEAEVAGLDLSQHSETAYAAGGGYGEVGSGHPGAIGEAPPRVGPQSLIAWFRGGASPKRSGQAQNATRRRDS